MSQSVHFHLSLCNLCNLRNLWICVLLPPSNGDAKQTLEIRVEQGEAVRLYIRSKEFLNPIISGTFLRESG